VWRRAELTLALDPGAGYGTVDDAERLFAEGMV
jgi:hypothetical protein